MDVLINADDFGKSQQVNEAICRCFVEGIIQRTTIMTTAPFFDQAVELSKVHGFFDKVGLHLNLDEGMPLSEEMRKNPHFCIDGNYRERVFLAPKYRYVLNKHDKLSVKQEIVAQMTKYLEAGFTLKHFDSHHFVHNNLSIIFIACRAGKDLGFVSTRLMEIRSSDFFFRTLYKKSINRYLKSVFTTSGQFLQQLNAFEEKRGNVEFMVHPTLMGEKLVNMVSWNPDRYERFEEYAEFISRIREI